MRDIAGTAAAPNTILQNLAARQFMFDAGREPTTAC
jgi:hypothetical protein